VKEVHCGALILTPDMSYAPRLTGVPSRQPSLSAHTSSASQLQSSALAARIASKRQELEDLKQLRDLSANLATQMALLEEKLATLRDGTESVACILANWDNVLRAISMASSTFFQARSSWIVWILELTGACGSASAEAPARVWISGSARTARHPCEDTGSASGRRRWLSDHAV